MRIRTHYVYIIIRNLWYLVDMMSILYFCYLGIEFETFVSYCLAYKLGLHLLLVAIEPL